MAVVEHKDLAEGLPCYRLPSSVPRGRVFATPPFAPRITRARHDFTKVTFFYMTIFGYRGFASGMYVESTRLSSGASYWFDRFGSNWFLSCIRIHQLPNSFVAPSPLIMDHLLRL